MSDERPMKVIRLNYWDETEGPSVPKAHITILAEPEEVRMGVAKSFIAVREDRISFGGGFPSRFNFQGLSHNVKYAGMVQDSPFPLSLLPSTMATPFPKQLIVPPFLKILPEIGKMGTLVTSFLG